MKVLVAGCGYVGSALAAELAEAGHSVIGLKRQPAGLPEGVQPLAADLSRPETLRALPSDIERVVYAVSPGGRTEEAYDLCYRVGIDHLLTALAASPVRRVILTASTAVYGQSDGSWVDEDSPTEPSSFTGRAILDAEERLAACGIESVSLRLAGIYGPGRTWLVRRVESGEASVEPADAEPPRYGNRIHRDDCAGALRHLLEAETVEPIYVGVDDEPAPLRDVHRFVAELLGAPEPPEGDAGRGRGGNKRCRNARLVASGYTMRVPSYREGYPGIVEAYRAV